MPLGREVDDKDRVAAPPTRHDQHMPRHNLTGLAGTLVDAIIFGVATLELERNPLAHHANAVHGIYQRLDIGFEEVAACAFNHRLRLGFTVLDAPAA